MGCGADRGWMGVGNGIWSVKKENKGLLLKYVAQIEIFIWRLKRWLSG